jgi:hypothetical protein
VRPDVRLILETLNAGGDPEELLLAGIAKISGGGKGQANFALIFILHVSLWSLLARWFSMIRGC